LIGAAIGAVAVEGAARLGAVLPDRYGTVPIAGSGTATLCFTPPEDCTALIRRELAAAGRQVLVQAYSFTSAPIAEALVAARRRGVEVTVLLDGDSANGPASVLASLTRGGVRVLLDDPPGIAHNKVMVIDVMVADRARVITGSFNFSRAAEERNAENLLVLRDPAIAAAYAANWDRRRAVSKPALRP
jgi:phosphatidylserine/phosphatidylglycerophosphate/cardiolipin synthase-like enzyme